MSAGECRVRPRVGDVRRSRRRRSHVADRRDVPLVVAGTASSARGCQGVLTAPAPELVQGCCSYGAHFSDQGPRPRRAVARRTSPTTSGSSRSRPQEGHLRQGGQGTTASRTGGPASSTTRASSSTARVGRAGPGCALHQMAMRTGNHHSDVEARGVLAAAACGGSTRSRTTAPSSRRSRSSGATAGARAAKSSAWWCTEAPEAFVGQRARVPRRWRVELRKMLGNEAVPAGRPTTSTPARRAPSRAPVRHPAQREVEAAERAEAHRSRRLRPVDPSFRPGDIPPSTTSTCAGDPRRRIRREEQRGAGDVIGHTDPAERVARRRRRASSGSQSTRAKWVFTSPGATAFTRTSGASSSASCRVRWSSAAFETLYMPDERARPEAADRDDVEDAPPCSRIHASPRALGEEQRSLEVDLEDLAHRARLEVDDHRPNAGLVAALFTRMSRPPSSSMQRATAASMRVGVAGRTRDRGHAAPARAAAPPRSPRARRACGPSTATAAPAPRRPRRSPVRCHVSPPVTSATWPSRRSAVPDRSPVRVGSEVEAGLALAAGRRDRVDVALAQDEVLVAPDLDLVTRHRARTGRGRPPRRCAPSVPRRRPRPTPGGGSRSAVAGMRIPARDLRSPISSRRAHEDPVGRHPDRVLDVVVDHRDHRGQA